MCTLKLTIPKHRLLENTLQPKDLLIIIIFFFFTAALLLNLNTFSFARPSVVIHRERLLKLTQD